MPCHVVGGVRCQVDHCSLQVCHLSQSTSRDIWQPALHQGPQTLRVDERGVNNPPEKRDREKGGRGGTMKSEGITVQSQEWQRRFRATTLVTKINPIILWRKGTEWHLDDVYCGTGGTQTTGTSQEEPTGMRGRLPSFAQSRWLSTYYKQLPHVPAPTPDWNETAFRWNF